MNRVHVGHVTFAPLPPGLTALPAHLPVSLLFWARGSQTFEADQIVDPWGRAGDPEEIETHRAEGREAVLQAFATQGKGLSKKLWQADMGDNFEIEAVEGTGE